MAVLPDASVTLCVTVVVPIGKVEPLAKPAILVVVEPGQLSVPTGAVYVTTAPPALVAFVEILEGQLLKVGAWLSVTVTVKLQVLKLPDSSVALNVLVVTPTGKVEPDGKPAICVMVICPAPSLVPSTHFHPP